MGQENVAIERSTPPRWGEVHTVSGNPDWLGFAEGITPPLELRIANANPYNPPGGS